MKHSLYLIMAIFLISCTPSKIKLTSISERVESTNFINIESLKEKWRIELSGNYVNSNITFSSSYGFISDQSGKIFCFDVSNGSVLGAVANKGVISTSPILKENIIYYFYNETNSNEGYLTGYDLLKGDEIYETELSGIYIKQLIKTNNGIIVISKNGDILHYDYKLNEKWKIDLKTKINSNGFLDKEILYVKDNNGFIYKIDIYSSKILKKIETKSKNFSGDLFIYNDFIISGDDNGFVYFNSKETGELTAKDSIGKYVNSPIQKDNKIYFATLTGELITFNGIKKIDKTKLGELFSTNPVINSGIIIIPDYSRKIIFYNLDKKMLLKKIDMEGRSTLVPAIFNNLLIVGLAQGKIIAYETPI